MTPILSYKNYIKKHSDNTAARKRLKRRILGQQMKIENPEDFLIEMIEFMSKWNMKRKLLEFRKTPEKIAREHGYLLPECFYRFSILIYDKEINNEYNPIFSSEELHEEFVFWFA